MSGTKWKPELPSIEKLEELLKDINEIENNTIRAIWLMLKLMKMQLFNDGNKRTAMLVTNYCGLRVRLNLPVIEKFL